eukprot:scaffold22677_cov105-Isochrysis_galbana.AAC.5
MQFVPRSKMLVFNVQYAVPAQQHTRSTARTVLAVFFYKQKTRAVAQAQPPEKAVLPSEPKQEEAGSSKPEDEAQGARRYVAKKKPAVGCARNVSGGHGEEWVREGGVTGRQSDSVCSAVAPLHTRVALAYRAKGKHNSIGAARPAIMADTSPGKGRAREVCHRRRSRYTAPDWRVMLCASTK